MTESIDPKICPICLKPNHCGEPSSSSNGRCWCAVEEFPREIFRLVPEEKINKACICKKCLDEFKKGGIDAIIEKH